MYETILYRSPRASAGCPGPRDGAQQGNHHISGQSLDHQALAGSTGDTRPSPTGTGEWPTTVHHQKRRAAAARAAHRYARCNHSRTHRALQCLSSDTPQPLDTRACHPPLGLDAQKKTLSASERDPLERAAFQMRQADQDAADLVIVDEVGSNIDLTRRYARAPAGERAFGSIPRNTPTNLTLIASLQLSGMRPSLLLPGGTDTAAFEVYISEVLAPTLRPGQIVLVDNLSAHKAPRIAEVLAKSGCSLWFLPTYSPDLSPIELAFAKIKTILRSIGARTREALEQAIAEALAQISAADAASFFRHCGYWIPSPMAQAFRSQL